MARTKKTDPHWVRLGMTREEYEDHYSYTDVPADFRWSNAEQGVGPKEARWAKRYRSKRNRKRHNPHPGMRGYGYGFENIRFR